MLNDFVLGKRILGREAKRETDIDRYTDGQIDRQSDRQADQLKLPEMEKK